MKRKTDDLAGAALDWAVAKCENTRLGFTADVIGGVNYTPSRSWEQGGPIIERERICSFFYLGDWYAAAKDTPEWERNPDAFGPTPLVATMRCYVASKLGEEVDIPDELA